MLTMFINNTWFQCSRSVCIIYISGKCTHFMSSRSALVLATLKSMATLTTTVLDFHLLPHLNLNTFNPKSLIFIYYKLPTYTQSIQLFQSFLLSLLLIQTHIKKNISSSTFYKANHFIQQTRHNEFCVSQRAKGKTCHE